MEDIANANDRSRGGRDGTGRKCSIKRKEEKMKTEEHQHFRNRHRWISIERDGKEEVGKKKLSVSIEKAKDKHFKKAVVVKIGKSCQVID